jgi:hypothetical protein
MSAAEETFAFQLRAVGIPFEREVRFAAGRRWRADFVINDLRHLGSGRLLVEVDGGTWINGRHTRGDGFQFDCIKLNEATLLGYHVLRVTPAMVDDGSALALIERALA